jgi:hypothetical protein
MTVVPLTEEEQVLLTSLKSKTKSKMTNEEMEAQARLEQKHETWARDAFTKVIEARTKAIYERLGPDSDKWDYRLREELADEGANVTLPPIEDITWANVGTLRQQLSSVRIQSSSLAREARRRSAIFNGTVEQLEAQWKGITSIDTEWKAGAAGEELFKSLKEEALLAKAHAEYVTACERTVVQTTLELHWIQQDKMGTRAPSELEKPQL